MYPTVEARWFVPGPLPAAVRTWFDAAGDAEPPLQARADLYLVSLSLDAPNVKLRAVDAGPEQRMEVKTRAGTLRTQALGPPEAQATGRIGKWQKWRFPLAEGSPAAALAGGAESWLRVEKRRRSRLFVPDGDGVREATGEELRERGCDVELSEIGVGQARFWSVCFEAFGPSHEGLDALLQRTAGCVLACGEPPVLPAGRSMSYPEWIARVGRGAG